MRRVDLANILEREDSVGLKRRKAVRSKWDTLDGALLLFDGETPYKEDQRC